MKLKQLNPTLQLDILNKITDAAEKYSELFINKTFLFVYNNDFIEVIFKKKNFKHLTGFQSALGADAFFKKSLNRTLKYNELTIDEDHNIKTALKKINAILNLFQIISKDILILKNFKTMTHLYEFALTDCCIVICLEKDTNKDGDKLNHYRINSLRVGDSTTKSQNFYIVDAVFSKNTDQQFYNCLNFIDKSFSVQKINDAVKQKINTDIFDKIKGPNK